MARAGRPFLDDRSLYASNLEQTRGLVAYHLDSVTHRALSSTHVVGGKFPAMAEFRSWRQRTVAGKPWSFPLVLVLNTFQP